MCTGRGERDLLLLAVRGRRPRARAPLAPLLLVVVCGSRGRRGAAGVGVAGQAAASDRTWPLVLLVPAAAAGGRA